MQITETIEHLVAYEHQKLCGKTGNNYAWHIDNHRTSIHNRFYLGGESLASIREQIDKFYEATRAVRPVVESTETIPGGLPT